MEFDSDGNVYMSPEETKRTNQVRYFEHQLGVTINTNLTRIFGSEFYDKVAKATQSIEDDEIIAEMLDTWPSVVMAIRWQMAFGQKIKR